MIEGRPEDLGAFFRELGPKEEEAYMTMADKLRAEGEARGRAEGEARGRASVQADALLKLLTLRFGPLTESAQTRVRTAPPAQLDRWMDAVLDVASLDELFAS